MVTSQIVVLGFSLSGKPREVYPPIHVISCTEKSQCPFYELRSFESEGGEVCVAYCKVTERYLTRSFVKKCILYWETCPYRQAGLSQ
jgi:hypothetical protein